MRMNDWPITHDQAQQHASRDYDEGNRNLIRQAYRRWQTGRYGAVEMKCFNKIEADTVRAFAAQHYPDMVLRLTWMVPAGLTQAAAQPGPRADGGGEGA